MFKAKTRMAHLKNKRQNEENRYDSWNFAADYEQIRGRHQKSRLGRRKMGETASNIDINSILASKNSGIPVRPSGFSAGKNTAQLKLNVQNVLNMPFNLYSYKQRCENYGFKNTDKEIKFKNVTHKEEDIKSILNKSFTNDKKTNNILNSLNDEAADSPSSPVNEEFMTCVHEPINMSKLQSSFCLLKTPGKQLTSRRSDDSPLDPLAGISDDDDDNEKTIFTVKYNEIKQESVEKPKSNEFFKPMSNGIKDIFTPTLKKEEKQKLDTPHSNFLPKTEGKSIDPLPSINLSNEHKKDIFTPSQHNFHQVTKTSTQNIEKLDFLTTQNTNDFPLKDQFFNFKQENKTLLTPDAESRPKLKFLTSETKSIGNNIKKDEIFSLSNNFKKEQDRLTPHSENLNKNITMLFKPNEHKDKIFTPSPYNFEKETIHNKPTITPQENLNKNTLNPFKLNDHKDKIFTPSPYNFEKETIHNKPTITPQENLNKNTINPFEPSEHKEKIFTPSPYNFEKETIHNKPTITPQENLNKNTLNPFKPNDHKNKIFPTSPYTFEKPFFQENDHTVTPHTQKSNSNQTIFKNDIFKPNQNIFSESQFKPNITNNFANMDIGKQENSIPPKDMLTPPYTEKILVNEGSNFVQKDVPFQPICLNAKPRDEENILYVNKKPYIVLTVLGKGGSSQVYKVLDEQHNTVAVKCVNLDNVEDVIANGYLNEIKLLAKLQDCETVIRMYDYDYVHETKKLNVVMEIGEIDFSKLLKNVDTTKNISVAMIVYYWSEMLAAVQEIHERGIIHSDLKPANFLIVKGRLKLIDFGISSSLQGDMTSVFKEITTGTYNYMSPEAISYSGEIAGYKITYKSDIWSLGCILYNLLYGQTPFSHIKNTLAKLRAIADPRSKIVFPDDQKTPIHLIIAMRLCFVRDPKLRPNASDLIQILELPTSKSSLTRQIDTLIFEELKHAFPNLSGEITQLENEIKGKKC